MDAQYRVPDALFYNRNEREDTVLFRSHIWKVIGSWRLLRVGRESTQVSKHLGLAEIQKLVVQSWICRHQAWRVWPNFCQISVCQAQTCLQPGLTNLIFLEEERRLRDGLFRSWIIENNSNLANNKSKKAETITPVFGECGPTTKWDRKYSWEPLTVQQYICSCTHVQHTHTHTQMTEDEDPGVNPRRRCCFLQFLCNSFKDLAFKLSSSVILFVH